MTVALANILFPLYIYPLPNAWNPLISAAKQYPDVTFTAVVNPYTGPDPGPNGCPNTDYIDAIASINKLANIYTMGYVHSANRWNCGPYGNWICPCSAPIADVKRNITTYASWASLSCNSSKPDIHIDSLFIDEAPGQDNGACLSYMSELTNYAKASGLGNKTLGGSVLFNAGAATDFRYFNVADVIVIVENTQQEYEKIPDIDVLNNHTYYRKSSVILYNHTTDATALQRNTRTILRRDQDNFDSLFITNRATDQYSYFPSNWLAFVGQVNTVAQANKKLPV